MAHPLVIGIGNPDCGDDGIGPLVASRLQAGHGAHIMARRGEGLDLIEAWGDADPVVLIDAAASAGQPGQIHRYDLHECALSYEPPHASTHGFGLADAIELARALDQLPPRIVLYAVEGARFEPGSAMTAPVRRSAVTITRLIAADLCPFRAFRSLLAVASLSQPPTSAPAATPTHKSRF